MSNPDRGQLRYVRRGPRFRRRILRSAIVAPISALLIGAVVLSFSAANAGTGLDKDRLYPVRDANAGRAGTPIPEREAEVERATDIARGLGAVAVGAARPNEPIALFPAEVQVPKNLNGIQVLQSPFTTTEYEQAQALINRLGDNGRKYSYSYVHDFESGQIIVATDAPQSDIRELERAFPTLLKIRPGDGPRPFSRQADAAPHWGGSRISVGSQNCTSGPIVKQANGNRLQLTAGHCWGIGHTLNSGGVPYGKVVNSAWPTWDQALFDNTTFGNKIYYGNPTTSSSVYQKDAGNPQSGLVYHKSGGTTGTSFHYVTSTHGVTCHSGYCWAILRAMDNVSYVTYGDSGGTVHTVSGSNAGVRGRVMSGDSITVFC